MTISRAVRDHAEDGASQTIQYVRPTEKIERYTKTKYPLTPIPLFLMRILDDSRWKGEGTCPDSA